MKKFLAFLMFILTTFALGNDKVLKVAVAGRFPMDKIVEIAKEDLEKKGYTVEITKFTDYVGANKGLLAKEFDANFHQHKPFMEVFNKGNNGNLVKITAIYDTYNGFYSKNIKNVKDIPNGASVAIPNDSTNKSRALKALADSKLITLSNKKMGELYDVADVVKNTKNLVLKQYQIPSLAQAYDENDLVYNWPAHVRHRGLNPTKDALILEKQSPIQEFSIILAAREDNKDSKKIKDLEKAMKSEKVKQLLEKEYSKEGYPVF